MRTFQVQVFSDLIDTLRRAFLSDAEVVDVGEWQSQRVQGRPEMVTRELLDVIIQWPIPGSQEALASSTGANVAWAEEHFQERVSGVPHNPPPSHERWPHRRENNAEHMSDGKFSHTYPERFWPKLAGGERVKAFRCVEGHPATGLTKYDNFHFGVRFEYGDLRDVVEQLRRSPLTRQAYLPVWFPEDTGAVHGERVPCTLGYLFINRGNKLHVTYHIRSCDFRRHFRDDVYLAGRLLQWMVEELDTGIRAGRLTMHITSFHVFQGDVPLMEMEERAHAAKTNA